MTMVNQTVIRHIDLAIRNLSHNAPPTRSVSTILGGNHRKTRKRTRTGLDPQQEQLQQQLQLQPYEKAIVGEENPKNKICQIGHQNDSNENEASEKDEYQRFHSRFAPVGLERQYSELYQLLEKGLIGVASDHTGDTRIDANVMVGNQSPHSSDIISTPCHQQSFQKTNVSALLMGPRGEGKSLVLDRCLMALEQRARTLAQKNGSSSISSSSSSCDRRPLFRVVRLNGVLLRGQHVAVVVQEIVRQLCEIVTRESTSALVFSSVDHSRDSNSVHVDAATNHGSNELSVRAKLHDIMQKQAEQFRSRKTTFHSSMACLNEAFQISCIDSIPILIVLEELDSFLPPKSKNRNRVNPSKPSFRSQVGTTRNNSGGMESASSFFTSSPRDLLLYHLLDRIAGKGSLLSLVGMCARLTTTESYEKRVRSRAQGTSKVIYFSPCRHRRRCQNHSSGHDGNGADGDVLEDPYVTLVEVLLSHFVVDEEEEDAAILDQGQKFMRNLKEGIRSILLPTSELTCYNSTGSAIDRDYETADMDERYKISHVFKCNRELGKSIRWFCRVMTVALTLYSERIQESLGNDTSETIPPFKESYLVEGLQVMGAEMFVVTQHGIMSNLNSNLKSRSGDLGYLSACQQHLVNLSGCQVAIILSAKRILQRDCTHENENEYLNVLTYEKMRNEYESYFVMKMKSSGPDCYNEVVFFKSFLEMLGSIFFVAKDHTGDGPNQYFFSKKYSIHGMHHDSLKRAPLHLGVHVEKDIMKLLLADKLNCSMALKDWGKVNSA